LKKIQQQKIRKKIPEMLSPKRYYGDLAPQKNNAFFLKPRLIDQLIRGQRF